jgi:polysaccharide biosynthesis PFTS motif protein
MNIVFETIKKSHRRIIYRYLKKGIPVWIIEPFYANHHKKGTRFFPPPLPEFINDLIKKGEIKLLKAQQLNASEIFFLSADKSVEVIESIFPTYRKEHEELFTYVSSTLKSSLGENVFKINLCFKLAEFYSVNLMIHRIEKFLGCGQILIFPDTNIHSYLYIKRLLSKSNHSFFEHPNIQFPIRASFNDFLDNFKKSIFLNIKLFAQTWVSGLLTKSRASAYKKDFTYGIAIFGPRQLSENRRGPDFIIDNKKIKARDVIYFLFTKLNDVQKKRLKELPGYVMYLPEPGKHFSHFNEWKKLLWLSLRKYCLRNNDEINASSVAFFNYFSWLDVLETIKIEHFITHCDFGLAPVGRNIALNQSGVQTWYFTDSMNFVCNLQEEIQYFYTRHPAWTYLNYDHFVTWDNFLAEFFKVHPGSFRKSHVVGCIWSDHIKDKNYVRKHPTIPALINIKNSFLLVAFDTSYSKNVFTSYSEGIAFAEHLLKLANAIPDVFIFLKEKKDRNVHSIFDSVLGPKLVKLYNKMSLHPRIKIFPDNIDASELISASDMVVSFPFTSTTFEALCANKPAIWHDPIGYYKNTIYGKVEGLTSHSYEELEAEVIKIKSLGEGTHQYFYSLNPVLMDPYRDGLAIERFRDLLTS